MEAGISSNTNEASFTFGTAGSIEHYVLICHSQSAGLTASATPREARAFRGSKATILSTAEGFPGGGKHSREP